MSLSRKREACMGPTPLTHWEVAPSMSRRLPPLRVRLLASTLPVLGAALAVLVLAGAGCTRAAEQKFDGHSLTIDNRYAQEIEFSALDARIPLGPGAFLRVDDPVADTREHLRALVRELGLTGRGFSLTNPATNGMQVHLRFRDGKQCSFIWARRDPDSRLTVSRVEHEKYHALRRMAPNATSTLSAEVARLGFRLNLADYDEEFAATLIEVITLYRLGISLDEINGSGLIVKAVGLLRSTRTAPDNLASTTVRTEDQQIAVDWPQGKGAIEVPFELLDDIPVVRCQLNGKPSFLYLDTAHQPISLYQDRLARVGLKLAAEEDGPRSTFGGHPDRLPFCGRFVLDFQDGLSIAVSRAPCVPSGGRAFHHDVDGVLGVKIMKALNGVIDLQAGMITFSVKAIPGQRAATNLSQPLRPSTNRPPSGAGCRR
jgi:hypothetical protein